MTIKNELIFISHHNLRSCKEKPHVTSYCLVFMKGYIARHPPEFGDYVIPHPPKIRGICNLSIIDPLLETV